MIWHFLNLTFVNSQIPEEQDLQFGQSVIWSTSSLYILPKRLYKLSEFVIKTDLEILKWSSFLFIYLKYVNVYNNNLFSTNSLDVNTQQMHKRFSWWSLWSKTIWYCAENAQAVRRRTPDVWCGAPFETSWTWSDRRKMWMSGRNAGEIWKIK